MLGEITKIHASLEGYDAYHQIKKAGRSGGVSVYCRQNLTVETLDHMCVSNENMETMTVKINVHGDAIILLAVYRHHSSTIETFSAQLYGMMHDNAMRNQKIILVGDININLNQQCPAVETFITNLQSLHFIPVITKPTPFPPSNVKGNPSLLDQIWINCLN